MNSEFLVTSLIVVASPGTGALVTVETGLSRGARAALIAAFGCTLGTVPHMLLAITGLAALLNTSPLAFAAVKYAGVAYLLYMAWKTLTDRGTLLVEAGASPRSDRDVVTNAVLVNLLNPKLSIFFLAFLPQFVAGDDPQAALSMAGLSLVFMAITFAVFSVYGVFAATVRDRVLARPAVVKWLRRSFALAFFGLGAKLAFMAA